MTRQFFTDPELVRVGVERYGLSYHASMASLAEQTVGLVGQTVLEVGGTMPPGFVFENLKVERWIAVQEPDYWREIGGGMPEVTAIPIESCPPFEQLGRYTVLLGQVEALPAALMGKIERVFSVAAFEHIAEVGVALRVLRRALAPEGALFAMFAPVWSAHDGHHLPSITDEAGRTFSFGNSPIPHWGHLLMRPPEMFKFLLDHTDERTASRICYYVYHSPQINRLFVEDYLAYAATSGFTGMIDEFGDNNITPDVQRQLELLHPGRTRFNIQGLIMILR